MGGRHRVFVYGSLLSGLRYADVMAGARPLGAARTEARFELRDLGPWPGVVAGKRAIVGEVYEVDDAHLARLDEFEDVPELYRRERTRLRGGGEAWIYVLQRPDGAPIPGGCWRTHLKERPAVR